MATFNITTVFIDPSAVSIQKGTLSFVAEETKLTVLKGSSVTAIPGAVVPLEPNKYRTFYTDTFGNKYQLGIVEIIADAALSDLLDALTP